MEDTFRFIMNSAGHYANACIRAQKYYFPTAQLEDEGLEEWIIKEMYDDGEFGEEDPYLFKDDVFDFEEEADQEWGVQ